MIESYRDLRVYQISYELALEVHKLTLKFPDFEKYELGSQARRAAVSIPVNIAEGYGKKVLQQILRDICKWHKGQKTRQKCC